VRARGVPAAGLDGAGAVPAGAADAGVRGSGGRGGAVALPEEATRERLPYGFIGRDGAIRELERAMRRKPGAVVVHGLGGVGKTTLARGFLEWLADTGGLEHAPLWFSMQEVRSAEFIVNRIGETIFGPPFGAQPMEARLEALVRAMRERRLVVVLDNFESVRGNPGAGVDPNLTEEDQGTLRNLIQGLRGGASKVLITSRGEEEWLGVENRSRVDLPGLEGEERWELCEAILEDLGIRVNRDDPALKGLMDQLGGHPLAMRVVLPKLETMSAGAVADALRRNFDALALGESEEVRRVYATLRLATEGVPEELRPLLVLLACHEGAVDADYFEAMAAGVDASWTRDRIHALFETMGRAGLLLELGQRIYAIHPALTGFLRSVVLGQTAAEVRDRWTRGFVEVFAGLADDTTPRPLHQQRALFEIHGSNVRHALAESRRLRMESDAGALTQGLAAFAMSTRDLMAADRLFRQFLEWARRTGQAKFEAGALHQLGMVAQERRDFEAAERWCRRSLEIKERLGDEHGAAITYGQLGLLAVSRERLREAVEWLAKAGTAFARFDDLHNLRQTVSNLVLVLRLAPASERESLLRIWTAAGLPPVPPELLEGAGDTPAEEGVKDRDRTH